MNFPNRNTAWLGPEFWIVYVYFIFVAWVFVLCLPGFTPGTAWTVINLAHFLITFFCFHWIKGCPFSGDQGIYDELTWWEQIDDEKQHTPNRKFFTLVPLFLYMIASHTTDYKNPPLLINTVVFFILLVAKIPYMHKVRLFGINGNP